jgi:hypothetical protein
VKLKPDDWTWTDVMLLPFIAIAVFGLACWILATNIARHLAARNKSCDKEPADRRPRRAF